MKRALITGITGQDGRYLAELLLGKAYEVHGLVRGQANPKRALVAAEIPGVEFVDGDLTDQGSLIAAVAEVRPDEVYNLGAISFVPLSWREPEHTLQVTGGGALRMLEAIRIVGGDVDNPIRFYQASSSEMFGKVTETPQTERTRFHPRSPYGVAKAYAHYVTQNYRESYGLHASAGILFNHESPRRGIEFVTRKVTRAVARIELGLEHELLLGNLDARRDWGYAGDYVEAMWSMVQQDTPGDYVIATGMSHSLRELVELAFQAVDVDIAWRGSGPDEVGCVVRTGETVVRIDPRFRRPADVDCLVGDASAARRDLGWAPRMGFEQLVETMVAADLRIEDAETTRAASAIAHG